MVSVYFIFYRILHSAMLYFYYIRYNFTILYSNLFCSILFHLVLFYVSVIQRLYKELGFQKNEFRLGKRSIGLTRDFTITSTHSAHTKPECYKTCSFFHDFRRRRESLVKALRPHFCFDIRFEILRDSKEGSIDPKKPLFFLYGSSTRTFAHVKHLRS